MKNLLCAALLAVTASCGLLGSSTGYDSSNVAPAAEIVVERHDGYVNIDGNLDAAQIESYLSESAAVTKLLASDPIPKALLDAALPPVLDRTEAYILSDTSLTAPQQVQRQRTIVLLRKLIGTN